MVWTIYSIGDNAFLQAVLQGVAMLIGGADYTVTARIATLIGAVVVMFRSVQTGGHSFDPKEILVGIIIFGMVFGTTVTVAIENVVTGAVVTQGGIPVGFAAPGSVVSLLGMRLTEQFEQAFSTPEMLQHGFQSSLETIKKVRINTMSVSNFGGANAPVSGADVYSSWVNYISECTIPGLEAGAVSFETIMRSSPFVDALVLNSVVNGTEIYTGGNATQTDCGAAFTQLKNFTINNFVPQFLGQISVVLGGAAGSASDATNIINDALTGVGLGASATASDFVLTSVLVPIFLDALSQSSEATYSSSYATMVSDAARNRASQWMGQSSLFNLYIQPVLAFIEGFQYAVMPLMIIVILFGNGALPLIGKFLGMMLWIQLWYPILAIVNLYEHLALTGAMSAMMGAGNGILTLAGTLQGDQSFLAWMAIGGLMASSVPMLAGAVAFGTWHGVQSLVAQIGGSETLRPDVAAPREIGQQYSHYQMAPLTSVDPTLGLRQTGSDRVDPSMTYTVGDTRQVESARQASEQATKEFRQRMSETTASRYSVDDRGGQGESTTRGLLSQQTEGLTTAMNREVGLVDSISTATGLSKDVSAQLAADGALRASAAGSGGGVAVNLARREDVNDTQRAAAETVIRQAFSDHPSLQNNLTDSLARNVTSERSHAWFRSSSSDQQNSLEQSAAKALNAQENYREAASQSLSRSASVSESAQAAVTAIRSSPEAREALAAGVIRYGLGKQAMGQAIQNGRVWRARYGGADGAQIMGELVALGGYDPSGAGRGSPEQQAEFGAVMTKALGGRRPVVTGSERNAGVASEIGPVSRGAGGGSGEGGGRGAGPVGSIGPVGSGAGSGVVGEVNRGLAGALAAGGHAEDDVRAHHQAGLERQRQAGAELAQPVAEGMVQRDRAQGERDRTAGAGEQTHGLVDRAAELLHGLGTAVGGAVAAGSSGHNIGDGAIDALQQRYGQRIEKYTRQGREAGLTEAQATYYGWMSALDGVPGRSFVTGDFERKVRDEAVGARMDPQQIVERLEAATLVADGGGAARRFADLAETNRLHGLVPGVFLPGSAMDRAVERATGRAAEH